MERQICPVCKDSDIGHSHVDYIEWNDQHHLDTQKVFKMNLTEADGENHHDGDEERNPSENPS